MINARRRNRGVRYCCWVQINGAARWTGAVNCRAGQLVALRKAFDNHRHAAGCNHRISGCRFPTHDLCNRKLRVTLRVFCHSRAKANWTIQACGQQFKLWHIAVLQAAAKGYRVSITLSDVHRIFSTRNCHPLKRFNDVGCNALIVIERRACVFIAVDDELDCVSAARRTIKIDFLHFGKGLRVQHGRRVQHSH